MKLNETREIKSNIERVKILKENEGKKWAERMQYIESTSFKALMAQNTKDG